MNEDIKSFSNLQVEKNKNLTCGCLYKCNDCIKCESEGLSKKEYFEQKYIDYDE